MNWEFIGALLQFQQIHFIALGAIGVWSLQTGASVTHMINQSYEYDTPAIFFFRELILTTENTYNVSCNMITNTLDHSRCFTAEVHAHQTECNLSGKQSCYFYFDV